LKELLAKQACKDSAEGCRRPAVPPVNRGFKNDGGEVWVA
jgi:hypothetical protein